MTEPDFSREMGGIWADFFRDLARSAEHASTRISALLDGTGEPEKSIRSVWGRKFLRLDALGLERGMTTRQISSASGIEDEPNAEKVLRQLEKAGLIEQVGGVSPKHWRLTRDQRRDRILRMSRLIPRGRWTTYGDFAVATSGNIRAARAVSRVAAKNPAFANPHRVLAKGGTIPDGWKDDEDRGPEECARRLEGEGLDLQAGRAPQGQRMYHDELRARLEESEAADDGGPAS